MHIESSIDEAALSDQLDELKHSHVHLLQTLIRAISSNPPGDTRAACRVVSDHLSNAGIAYTIYAPQEDKPNIVSSFQGEKGEDGPHVVLNGHIDVFPFGKREDWDRDPLGGDNDGDFIHGVGAVDMKSGTAAILSAYTHLYQTRDALRGRVTIMMVSDEETGGKWGSRWLLENKPEVVRGDVLLNAEPGGLQSIRMGEKGTLRMTASIKTKGALGPYLNLSRGANRIGVDFVKQVIERVEALRPSLPEKLLKHLKKESVRRAADEIMGKGASALFLYPTVNVGVWQGGLKVNMIPSSAEIQLDIRLPIGMNKKEVFKEIDIILDAFPEISIQEHEAASNPSNMCSEDHPIVDCIADVAKGITGVKPVALPGLGGTDAKFWRYAGLNAYTYGLSPMTMASTQERVSIKEYTSLIKVYVIALSKYLA